MTTRPLVARVAAVLGGSGVPYALIGAGALAAHGVARSTFDLDLFTTAPVALRPEFWTSLAEDRAVSISVRNGDAEDPLLGVVRIAEAGERDVDSVVGRWAWQSEAVARAKPLPIGGVSMPVVTAADLVLFKLYAGGSQDCWDIEQLLADTNAQVLAAEVDSRVAALPASAGELWQRLRPAR